MHATKTLSMIPVIDLFAGPGGLGEGFSACCNKTGRPRFRIVLSIEKDKNAHMSLELRAFFRQFKKENLPEDYYSYLRGKISRSDLFENYPIQAKIASDSAWHAELGSYNLPPDIVDQKVREVLGNAETWVLIGGPPCQGFSKVGRGKINQCYKEFLRFIRELQPLYFVMENVPQYYADKEGLLLNKVLRDFYADSYTAEPRILQIDHYGVFQSRNRLFIMGNRLG